MTDGDISAVESLAAATSLVSFGAAARNALPSLSEALCSKCPGLQRACARALGELVDAFPNPIHTELAKSLQISDESGFQYKNCWGHWRHQGNKPSVVEEVIDLLTICRRDEAGNHCPASWITLRPPLQTLAREGNISTCSREVVGLTRAEADRFLHFECALALVQDAEEINLEQKGINWSAILALPAPEMDATT